MAEKEKEHPTEETIEGGEKKKSGNMLLIIIIVVLVLILVIGGVVVYMMSGNDNTDTEASSGTKKEASAHEAKAEDGHATSEENSHGSVSTEVGIMYPLDLFTVNLLSESGRRYLKVEMNLELEGEELAVELDTKKPVLRDIIIRILSSKSLEEISTAKGKETLKEQIVSELNTRIKDGKIKNVYFVDFVVQ
ncbi:MAG: flagellar basal body-associated protein FliL [Sulfuricurvum sp.]